MVELIERSAPHGFLIYCRNDVHPVTALAGDRADCVAYLMGNHVIAARMFRHDPRAMMYAPLHTVIREDQHGDAWFTVDQEAMHFHHAVRQPRVVLKRSPHRDPRHFHDSSRLARWSMNSSS
jgi:hypothetical protein